MKTGIYKITNKENNKVYIGQATDIEQRLKEHKQKRFIPIDMWINMLGAEHFDFEVLEECSQEELDSKEKFYIDKYNSRDNGYNKQPGGSNNSIGEGNGRARLTEEDVIQIRIAYKNHEKAKDIFLLYQDKISLSQFQAVWQGRSWSYVMPEVFTDENKHWYISEQCKNNSSLTKDQVIKYRTYYITHTSQETYQKLVEELGPILREKTFDKILVGDVRDGSIYKGIPVYSKKRKRWELKGEPVQTTHESVE